MGKRVLRLLLWGALGGLAVFGLILVVLEILSHGIMDFHQWGLARKGVGAILIGLAVTLPALVSESRKVPASQQRLVHAGISFFVICLVVPITGWLPQWIDARFFVIGFFLVVLVAVIIWYFTALFGQGTARQINERLQAQTQGDPGYRRQLRESYFQEEEQRRGKYKKWSPEAAKSDSLWYSEARDKLSYLLRNRKEPEVNMLTVRVGIAILLLFALFFVVMGLLPTEYFEVP